MPVRAIRLRAVGLFSLLLVTAVVHGQEPATELPPPRPLPPPPGPMVKPLRVPAVPAWLPRYDLDVHIDIAQHDVTVRQYVTWFNRHAHTTDRLVFNALSLQGPGWRRRPARQDARNHARHAVGSPRHRTAAAGGTARHDRRPGPFVRLPEGQRHALEVILPHPSDRGSR
jgi:hypothetical protein